MNAKQRAVEIYTQHIALATTDGRQFRRTVMDQLMSETGCSLAAAATHYNNAKKNHAPVEGLGRAPVSAGLRKPGAGRGRTLDTTPDDQCFTVLELTKDGTVGRMQSFEFQGIAGEEFESKCRMWPNASWVMIQGLGPNPGNDFQLGEGEKEIRRYEVPQPPAKVDTVPA
jgi:hypothetical protein